MLAACRTDTVGNERGTEEAERLLKCQHSRSPAEGDPSKRASPHRLGLDIGGQWKRIMKVTKGYYCWATKKDNL
jgi:hypothetical protein